MASPKSLVGPAVIYTFSNVISASIPFLLLPVLTRVLTPEEYGQVAMFSVVTAILGAFTGLSVHGAVGIRFFQQEKFDFPRYVSTCLAILLASTAVVFVLVGMFLPWLVEFTKLPAKWLLAAVLVSGAQFLIMTLLSIWQSNHQPLKYGAMRIAQSAIDAIASLILVISLGLAWEGRAGGIATATFVIACAALLLMYRGGWVRGSPDKHYARDALNFCIPLIPHTVGGMLIAMIDRFMITNLLDIASTGIYLVGLQIGMVLGLLTDSFNRAFSPWLFQSLKQARSEDEFRIVRFTYIYFIIVILIAVLIGIFAPAILGVAVGEKFRTAAPIVAYITIGYAFGGMYYMVANYIFYTGRTAQLALITLTTGLLNVVVSYFLLKNNGIVGAAQAFLLAQATLFLGTWWLANRSKPMPWGKVFAFKEQVHPL
jgi:O-antigen/teichoic acid export membrane protein